MGFYVTTTYTAQAKEFKAVLRQRPSTGAWDASITFTDGRVENYFYPSEKKLREDLNARSAHDVKFVRNTQPPDDSVEAARQAMLATNPRKIDVTQGRATAPAVVPKSALAAAGFTEEEEKAVIDSMYSAAAQIRSTWYADTSANRQTVELYMRDHGIPFTAEKYGEAITYLYQNNYLVRLSRKRGDAALVPYHSPSATAPEIRAQDLSTDELRAIEFARQKEAIRRNKMQNPNLSYAIGRTKL